MALGVVGFHHGHFELELEIGHFEIGRFTVVQEGGVLGFELRRTLFECGIDRFEVFDAGFGLVEFCHEHVGEVFLVVLLFGGLADGLALSLVIVIVVVVGIVVVVVVVVVVVIVGMGGVEVHHGLVEIGFEIGEEVHVRGTTGQRLDAIVEPLDFLLGHVEQALVLLEIVLGVLGRLGRSREERFELVHFFFQGGVFAEDGLELGGFVDGDAVGEQERCDFVVGFFQVVLDRRSLGGRRG